ncbi:hypothetical protein HPB50_023567 [Hyalomma asiaticum]|uniref:Uncharacterized protein n=1 Tax=Hyalomma asiaticum TaxID=266040 RepID=A0ACB7T3J1_HYAAI|nr:hypothetical protein HPB50_023567 [Hyalomma asiaticum]
MVKASWAEVTATCVQNCFRKAGFADVGPDADPEASEEDHSGGDLWQLVVNSDMGGRDMCWDDFVTADDDADTAEPCTDEGIVNEVHGKSDSEESDDDNDETLEPAPTSVPVAIGYIDSLRQLVCAKGLGEEHAVAFNKLETTLIASALSKQTLLLEPQSTLEALLRPRASQLPPHIQSAYVHNALKLWARLVAAQEDPEGSYSQLLSERLPLFVQSGDLEVQERACCALNLVKQVSKMHARGERVSEELQTLFAGELNPVAPKAQKKVPLPEGLDLDQWINDPPSASSSDEEENTTEIFIKSER